MYPVIHNEFNKTNRLWIAHNEQEISAIIRTSVFCVDKICFPRTGHFITDNLKLFICSPSQLFFILLDMCKPMHATATFITEAFCLVTDVQVF